MILAVASKGVEGGTANLGAAEEVAQHSGVEPRQNYGAAMANAQKMAAEASASIRKKVLAGVDKVVAQAAKQLKDQQSAASGTKVLSIEEAMDLLKKTSPPQHDVET